jgi:hypothetical protein
MMRYLLVVIALVGIGTTARAGGPPPLYVVVDKVVLEPSVDAPERIRIEGSFVRVQTPERYEYGKPVSGYIYLSLEAGKEKECRAEWAKWQKAAGTGKVVNVGSCGQAGTFLATPIHKLSEPVNKPDAAYSTGQLGVFGNVYAEGGLARQAPVQELLDFVKAREQSGAAAGARP